MRRFFLIWAALLAATGLAAQQIDFTQEAWEEVKTRAAKEGKGIFVDIYTSWCLPCRKMSATVFTNKDVADYINAHYVAVKLDAEKEKDHAFFRLFTPPAYPSFYWLNGKGELLDTHTGYMPADTFLVVTRQAEKSTISAEWETCRKLWEEGDRQPDFVRKYLFGILPQVRPADIRPLLNEYIAGLTEEEKSDAETGRMVMRFSRSIENDEVFRTLLRYNDKYQRETDFTETGKQMYMTLVRVPMADRRRDPSRYKTDLEILHTLEFPSKAMYMELLDMETMLFDGNYREGLNRALSVTQRYGETYTYLYAEICYTLIIAGFFAEGHRPAPAETRAAEEVARRAFELTPSQCTLTYLAAVHALKGEYRKAYELMMHAPFYEGPALSNAVYSLLQLPSRKEL